MSRFLVGVVGLIYLYVCVTEYRAGNHGWSVVYFGYALANVGTIMAMTRL